MSTQNTIVVDSLNNYPNDINWVVVVYQRPIQLGKLFGFLVAFFELINWLGYVTVLETGNLGHWLFLCRGTMRQTWRQSCLAFSAAGRLFDLYHHPASRCSSGIWLWPPRSRARWTKVTLSLCLLLCDLCSSSSACYSMFPVEPFVIEQSR